ncbi:MAG: hypothetical protein ACK4OF_05595 [Aquificaceae bacterium]
MEEGGFSLHLLVISHIPYLEDLLLENLERIRDLSYEFHGAR